MIYSPIFIRLQVTQNPPLLSKYASTMDGITCHNCLCLLQPVSICFHTAWNNPQTHGQVRNLKGNYAINDNMNVNVIQTLNLKLYKRANARGPQSLEEYHPQKTFQHVFDAWNHAKSHFGVRTQMSIFPATTCHHLHPYPHKVVIIIRTSRASWPPRFRGNCRTSIWMGLASSQSSGTVAPTEGTPWITGDPKHPETLQALPMFWWSPKLCRVVTNKTILGPDHSLFFRSTIL